MNRFFVSTSVRALVAAGVVLAAPLAAQAGNFTVSTATTTQQQVSGTNVGTVTSSGSITTSGVAVLWNGAATSTGVSITNDGTISSTGGRAFDTSGSSITGIYTLVNNGTISASNDTFRINDDFANGTLNVTNYGTMTSATGQVFDLANVTAATAVVTITNYGTLESGTADVVRPGTGGTVINYGRIEATGLTSDGDGVDFQTAGGTVVNKSTGVILGAKHGITGDGAITVTNELGGSITGQNGSGINVDSTGATVVTITNYGTITGAVTGLLDDDGAADGVPDGDGDGIDVDGQILLHNYGTVQGTGATGTNDGISNTADGIAAGGGTIYNYAGAVIEAYDNYPNDGSDDVGRAILIDDSNGGAAPFATTIINQGTIRSDGVAITLVGNNNDTIENYSVISSDDAKAVDMGGGDDLFIYHIGSSVTGYVTGGAGTDTFELAGTGSFDLSLLGTSAQYRDFEALLIAEGAVITATGTSDFAGTLEIDGSLTLNGSLAAAGFTIANGATLTGNSTVATLTVENGGTVSPGNSIGTVTVTGTATFNTGSTYVVEIDQTSSDQIVAGTLALNGGTVQLSSSGPLNAGAVYTIISATSTTTAGTQFDTLVSPDYLFITPTLGRDGASVTLTLARNGTSFASYAQTANQAAVANALEAGGTAASYLTAATTATDTSQFATGFDLLSGEVHASVGNTLYTQSTLIGDTLAARLRQSAPTGSSPAMAALAAGGPALAYAAPSTTKSPIVTKAPVAAPVGPAYAAWAQGFGQWSTADGTGNSAEIDSSLGGFLAGADVTLDASTFGFAAGYVSANTDVDARLSSADTSTFVIAAYAGTSLENFRLRGGASYGWTDTDTQRTASFMGLTQSLTASYDGGTANVFIEAAYAVEMNAIAFEPFAQMAWSWIDTDSFTESGGSLALSSDGLSFDVPYSTLGLRLATSIEMGSAVATPHASLGWRHAFGDITPEAAMAFAESGAGFAVQGAPIAEDSFVLGAGIDVKLGKGFSLNIGYEGEFASDVETNAVRGGLVYRF
ncbi:autotransporter domain-containing protein [Ancylobacter sp. WKF20]|uniref:autotransporter outer membrane beta-barrel domain-containing protein n=1 Tax=Ancylobacter sp. WKF20 TaxID=3039801 RepID=UPI002434295F|nr:autotransporter outer membrane beta-barrel domain-containing protein [Ancylobacter sp. WKF20]WGD28541.1 autotransporter domain-containing protein [Ancylobacter sp. WKF20]